VDIVPSSQTVKKVHTKKVAENYSNDEPLTLDMNIVPSSQIVKKMHTKKVNEICANYEPLRAGRCRHRSILCNIGESTHKESRRELLK